MSDKQQFPDVIYFYRNQDGIAWLHDNPAPGSHFERAKYVRVDTETTSVSVQPHSVPATKLRRQTAGYTGGGAMTEHRDTIIWLLQTLRELYLAGNLELSRRQVSDLEALLVWLNSPDPDATSGEREKKIRELAK